MTQVPIKERFFIITETIARTAKAPASVNLIAVSKGQRETAIEEVLALGHRTFGENRVQEAHDKWPDLKQTIPGITLHLIGPLQTNKVKEAVALFNVIQTIDREKLADALAAEMIKQGRRPDCFIQVNTGDESQKAGIAPGKADALIAYCRKLNLPIVGLMCIPPVDQPPAPHFALLATIAKRNGLDQLSMGMSEDFETAIRLGATHIRVGRALFGERN